MQMSNKKQLFSLSLFTVLFVGSFAALSTAGADEYYSVETDVPKNETISIDRESRPDSVKILGGTESKTGDWPWMTALLSSDISDTYQAQFCGGVLVGSSWILTAAHCVDGKSPNEIDVVVGAYDLSAPAVNRIQVKSIRIHSQYNATHIQNDIALLEIAQPSSQPPLPLFAGESREGVPSSLIGEMTTALGWGMADNASSLYYPETLRQVDLPIVPNSYCDDIYGSPYLLQSQICAGYYEGKDTCGGDSGGAMVSEVDGTWVHVGLVSFGAPCDEYNGWYGVYSRTSSYIGFIKQYVPNAEYFPEIIVPSKPEAKRFPWPLFLSAIIGAEHGNTAPIINPPSTPSKPENQTMTEKLAGYWRYTYTIISIWNDYYYLNIDEIEESTSSPGEYNVFGEDEYGNLVIAGYDPTNGNYFLLDTGNIIDKYYLFNFSGEATVTGCYYQIDNADGSWSNCFSMRGNRLSLTKSIPIKKDTSRLTQKEKERLVQQEASKFYIQKKTITNATPDHSIQKYYKQLKTILTVK